MIAVHDVLRGHALILSLDSDGHTMLVATADHSHLAAIQTHITRINIGGNIYAGQMSDVDRPVGVWKGCGDQGSLILFVHDVYILDSQTIADAYRHLYKPEMLVDLYFKF